MGVVRRAPCPLCRDAGGDHSGDNLAWYEDGHGFCFACNTYFASENVSNSDGRSTHVAGNLIESGEYVELKKRRLTARTLEKFGYSIGKHNGSVVHIAPYMNQAGEIAAQHLRLPNKDFLWRGNAKNVQLFGQHLWSGCGKRLVITEGEIDCMTISQLQDHKWPVVSLPSGAAGAKRAIADNLEWVLSYEVVVLCFDNDDPGRAAANEAAALLPPGKAHIAVLPLKDASDMMQAGRGAEIIPALWNARPYRPDGIVSASDLLDVVLSDPPRGYSLPFPRLSEMLQGLRKGELVLFTAGSGIGKSTAIHEIGYHLVRHHGCRVGVMALEESKKRTLERYLGIVLNIPIHTPEGRKLVTQEQITSAFKEVTKDECLWFYDHFGSTEIETLLNKIRYMVKALNIDFLILDHISIVVSGLQTDEGERRTIDILMTALRSLVEETGVGIIAISHLRRPDKGKSYGEGREVALSDLRGSASLEQLSDIVVSFERNQQDTEKGNYAIVRVLKSRLVGVLGVADTLIYSHETGRLLPCGSPIASVFSGGENPYQTQTPPDDAPRTGELDF